MAVRAVRLIPGAIVVVALLSVAACSGGPAPAARPTTAASTPTTVTPTDPVTATTTPPVSTAPDTRPVVGTTATTVAEPTATTEPPPGVDEAAQRRPASPLPPATGFARFEPRPAWKAWAPLTGRVADPTTVERAALAVKIDNSVGGQPQFNLADADVVFEENVEGVTRFVAVFHTAMPDRIGPVRSARESDLDIVSALNRPILAWSGGNGGVTTKVNGAHEFGWLANLSAQRTDCFWRSGTRGAPHNLMLDPVCARDSATGAGPARPLFTHGYGAVGQGAPAASFDVRMDGIVVSWTWDDELGRFLRSQRDAPHVDVDGERVGAENVVVLRVTYVASEADERSPEAITVGSGAAVVHRDGLAIDATWFRADRFAPYVLLDAAGDPVRLAPGTTFVELARG